MLYTIYKNDMVKKKNLNRTQGLIYLTNIIKSPYRIFSNDELKMYIVDSEDNRFLLLANNAETSRQVVKGGEVLKIDFIEERERK